MGYQALLLKREELKIVHAGLKQGHEVEFIEGSFFGKLISSWKSFLFGLLSGMGINYFAETGACPQTTTSELPDNWLLAYNLKGKGFGQSGCDSTLGSNKDGGYVVGCNGSKSITMRQIDKPPPKVDCDAGWSKKGYNSEAYDC